MNERQIKIWLQEIYPVTIISDRYTGTYSGNLWTCWPMLYDQVPFEIDSDDVTCMEFWYHYDKSMVGIGNTPTRALNDLIRKFRKKLK